METLKLTDIKAPVVRVELLDGSIRDFDPIEVIRSIEARSGVLAADDATLAKSMSELRMALGVGIEEASDYHVILIIRRIGQFVVEEVAGKGVPPVRRS